MVERGKSRSWGNLWQSLALLMGGTFAMKYNEELSPHVETVVLLERKVR